MTSEGVFWVGSVSVTMDSDSVEASDVAGGCVDVSGFSSFSGGSAERGSV